MHSRIRYPERVSQPELDVYLKAGWRCTGQSIYTSHFMRFPPETDGRIFSTIPTRLNLEGYTFRKSLNRLYRKVHQHFRVTAGEPLVWDEAMEEVHSKYQALFPDRPLADLERYQSEPEGPFTFDTRCVKVYQEGELAAFSVFNLGEKSLYSSQGIYDPKWRKYSLGFFTMLEEIGYAQQTGRSYFYPGYVVPDYPEFDYKKRVGPLEYFLLQQQRWVPEGSVMPADVPINQMRNALQELQHRLLQVGLESHLMEYTLFDIRFFDNQPLPYLEFPLILLLSAPEPARFCPVAVFVPKTQQYAILDIKFFGIGVHHVPTYEKIMTDRPDATGYPIAIMEVKEPELELAPAVSLLQREIRKASFL
ncbi:MAG: GNAT family N-acetyltransferase [Phaeodactylibacter sp.]|uniref:GNAT family N-acetyltransferase n=1 Tax=Phaeodactylibacter sp. TaxID=1940289 RepID=UPI0032ED2877